MRKKAPQATEPSEASARNIMEYIKALRDGLGGAGKVLRAFALWLAAAVLIGAAGGVIGGGFHRCIDLLCEVRAEHGIIRLLLPVAGLVIVLLYRLSKCSAGTNDVIIGASEGKPIPILMLPLIIAGTLLTQLFGGSAGKEGAALQIGGSAGYFISRLFKLKDGRRGVAVMCGMSAVFAAVFGTPLTAAVFAVEVCRVGALHVSALLPCVISSVTAELIAIRLGVTATVFPAAQIPSFGLLPLLLTLITAALGAVVSMAFCALLHRGGHFAAKTVKNPYLRILIGGAIVAAVTVLSGTQDYNGAGMDVAVRAVGGEAVPYAFALKLVLTVISIAVGFRGGEIVPSMFVGATLGCTVGALLGPLFGVSAGFCAQLGLIAVFCGMVNCPIAALLMGVELFGSQGMVFFALSSAVAFALSGNFGLYGTQRPSNHLEMAE